MRQQDVVCDAQRLGGIPMTRRMLALFVAEGDRTPRLVVRDPMRHTIAESFAHDLCVIGKGLGSFTRTPPAALLKGLR